MQIHEIIRTRRTALGLTQEQLAGKLGVSAPAVNKWERGNSYPDITLIRDICAILQVSEHELLTASEDVEARTAETLAKNTCPCCAACAGFSTSSTAAPP